MRTQIEDEIEQRWQAEKAERSRASPSSDQLPPEINAYYKAWRKAHRNQYGRKGDGLIEKAYEAWEIALIDCPHKAFSNLGGVYQGVHEFDNLPTPNGNHVRTSKKEIEATVLKQFKANPNKYYPD